MNTLLMDLKYLMEMCADESLVVVVEYEHKCVGFDHNDGISVSDSVPIFYPANVEFVHMFFHLPMVFIVCDYFMWWENWLARNPFTGRNQDSEMQTKTVKSTQSVWFPASNISRYQSDSLFCIFRWQRLLQQGTRIESLCQSLMVFL